MSSCLEDQEEICKGGTLDGMLEEKLTFSEASLSRTTTQESVSLTLLLGSTPT